MAGKTTYWVLWTFCANFGSKPVKVNAVSVTRAIEDSCFYNPRKKSSTGEMMRFHVFSMDGHVFSGSIEEAERFDAGDLEAGDRAMSVGL